jgi:hypothetical protein
MGVNQSARRGKVRNDHQADWEAAWFLFPGNMAYVWHGALHATTVAESLNAPRLRHPRANHMGQRCLVSVLGLAPVSLRILPDTSFGVTPADDMT